jgi:hypothetical protein
MNTCEYLVSLFNYCLHSIISNKVIRNCYLKLKSNGHKKIDIEDIYSNDYGNYNENIVFLETTQDNDDKNENYIRVRNFVCNECRKKIMGEIYMFNDRSFCNNKCRKKSMDKNLNLQQ